MTVKISNLTAKKAVVSEKMSALAGGKTVTPEQLTEFNALEVEHTALKSQIFMIQKALEASAESALPVSGQEVEKMAAAAESDPYISDAAAKQLAIRRGCAIVGNAKSLAMGGVIKMLGAAGGGGQYVAREIAKEVYGERHPITKALMTSSGSAGGYIVPPDYMAEIIELLRPATVVRRAGPRNVPMPRGTMTMPGQASAATASYGQEGNVIAESQQTLDQIVASYKKLTTLVPVTNDMMRYADPAVDAFIRDDLVLITALREDKAFLIGTGEAGTPRGYLSFANGNATTAGTWNTGSASIAAVGGGFITSTLSFNLGTAASELVGAINTLDTANVPDKKRAWFMHPRSFNYLNGVQNSLGVYVYREELSKGTLFGYPFYKTTQLPINIADIANSNKDCSFVILAEMTESMIFESMQLELSVSREGSYIDANGNQVSAFQRDLTLIRGIMEHDFQLRHDAAVAVIQFVRWAPQIT